ncbi:hypothetical protein LTR08_005264 [Meristemomyces frigidus]|nr:hypothetical protein LTR08_005264 [Meristemomyces frigidus]
MLQAANWGVPNSYKPKKTPSTHLSDDELRRRIFANVTVLFPSSTASDGSYEIVYGSRPRSPEAQNTHGSDASSWQYAMAVRRNGSGDYTPLVRGQASSAALPWSMVLQGLLDVTATAIHRKLSGVPMPILGIVEQLPVYSPPVARGEGQTLGS